MGNSSEPARLIPATPATFKKVLLSLSPIVGLPESGEEDDSKLVSDSVTGFEADRTDKKECELGKNIFRPKPVEEEDESRLDADSGTSN